LPRHLIEAQKTLGVSVLDLCTIITELSQKRPVFHNEADFQHALAWEIREHYPDAKIRLEMKVHGPNTKVYADILAVHEERIYAVELKYKTRGVECVIAGEEFTLNNHGAQDIGRYDVLKDLQRLEQMVVAGVIDEGILVFLTNDSSYYSDPEQEKQTVDRDFRLHEGKKVQGKLTWGEQTGQGTMKGREEPLSIRGQYDLNWANYSRVSSKNDGEFQYLMLSTTGLQTESNEKAWQPPSGIFDTKIEDDVITPTKIAATHHNDTPWFDSFSKRGEVPLSQVDLRDKLAGHLREVGYSVSVNRDLGKDKIDIWAQRDDETIAIEVRNKTALLQTIYEGQSVLLKNQAAQDVSRYDFINDIGKLERVVGRRRDVKGYALLLTNDAMYWQPAKKHNAIDDKFRIHDGRLLSGTCSWSDEAARGTTSGREQPVHLTGTYKLTWQQYLNMGTGRNEGFRALLVEVTDRLNAEGE